MQYNTLQQKSVERLHLIGT